MGTPWCQGQAGRGNTGVSRRQLGECSEVPQGAPAGSLGEVRAGVEVGGRRTGEGGTQETHRSRLLPRCGRGSCPGATPPQGLALRRPLGAGRSRRVGRRGDGWALSCQSPGLPEGRGSTGETFPSFSPFPGHSRAGLEIGRASALPVLPVSPPDPGGHGCLSGPRPGVQDRGRGLLPAPRWLCGHSRFWSPGCRRVSLLPRPPSG